jgi:hypothetical protein
MGAIALAVSGNQISSDFLMARSTASCGPAVGGGSHLQNLVINGQSLTVTGAANQTVTLPNGSAIINEQVQTIGATSGELTVRALHVLTHDTVTRQPVADVSLGTAVAGTRRYRKGDVRFCRRTGWPAHARPFHA